ncbi:NAD(P)/FAD-dependent oxidoreductase [Streptomyces sp. NA04227]|uniref:NAD(P)/FAD-dependent oxidoreductase n=1 Tax=Streptomyces sp. NA04227 TaxID=2742136 RepID=UPI0015908808|nr:FAD-dependent oxidoreductase [Streptomyces sp. NA04227]QKW08193.1 NAD(P)/FAD-dependent oxidoreductase [Streptomyces sp. NA04227]
MTSATAAHAPCADSLNSPSASAASDPIPARPRTGTLLVVGAGMAAHRLVTELREQDPEGRWQVTVLGAEPHAPYDRIALSSCAEGRSPAALALSALDGPHTELRTGTTVTGIDRAARTVTCADGARLGYDALVLATGARPFVPPVPGRELPGCLTYRTLDDIAALRTAAAGVETGVVVGGGLLGLEAANALRHLGVRPHVVETAPHLMPAQTDAEGGALLGRLVTRLGVDVHCGTAVSQVEPGPDGRVHRVELSDGTQLPARLVVFAAGVRPRDELAESAGLARAERGGILTDQRCRTEDPHIWAIGDCAAVDGRAYGLVAPANRMAEAVARQLLGDEGALFTGGATATELKLLGVDVASLGDVRATTPGALRLTHADAAAGTYAKLVLGPDGRTLLGGVLVGDTAGYSTLRALLGRELTTPAGKLLTSAA